MTLFPGPLPDMRVYWFEAGDRFAFVDRLVPTAHDVRVYDMPSGTSAVVNIDANAAAVYSYPVPGRGGASLFALRRDPEVELPDVVAIDMATGAVRTLLTAVEPRGVSWAIVPFELDRDGDGLANGIDATPDG
jgi:hypothetical protein